MAETPLQQAPRFLSLPFPNTPVLQNGQHVGFAVGVTLAHEAETVTESVEVICGPEQAAALSTGPIADFTTWSRQAIIDHDLVAKANAAMDAKLAAIAAN
jgi:hypothetical protein